MHTILLILDNAIEFDLTRTVLTKLGFNVLSLQRGADMHSKLKEHFPDVVITSVLGKQDTLLKEFIDIRSKRGTPKFIWVGAESRGKKLNEIQLKLIDATLDTPVQPEELIEKVCLAVGLLPQTMIDTYRKLLQGSMAGQTGAPKAQPASNRPSPIKSTGTANFRDEKRAATYSQIVSKIEKQDKVFTGRDLDRFNTKAAGDENTLSLHEQKKSFIKALFKK